MVLTLDFPRRGKAYEPICFAQMFKWRGPTRFTGRGVGAREIAWG